MKVKDLYKIKPQTMGTASLVLVDGRSLVDALNSYDNINIPVGQRLSIQRLKKHLDDAGLAHDTRKEIEELEIDETSSVEGNLPDLTAIHDNANQPAVQNFVVVVATISLFLVTIVYTGIWAWLAFIAQTKPSINHLFVLAACWTMVIWKSQGIISRERRDLMSVIVGDAPSKNRFWDNIESLGKVMKNR
ncbi:hypothetical protein E1386_11305 [Salmonella enterica subsp. enterica serovar Enteritidis]|nr:hypothetical protein [Salmonella enterica subsp. enterica serovar Enteritidis]